MRSDVRRCHGQRGKLNPISSGVLIKLGEAAVDNIAEPIRVQQHHDPISTQKTVRNLRHRLSLSSLWSPVNLLTLWSVQECESRWAIARDIQLGGVFTLRFWICHTYASCPWLLSS